MGIEALNPFNIVAGIFDAIFHKQTPEEMISKMLEDYKKNPNGDGDSLLAEIKKDIGFDPNTGELDESKLEGHPELAQMADAIQQMETNGFSSFNILDSLTGSADAPEPGKKMGLEY